MVVACFAMSIQLALLPPSNTPQIRLQESHPLVRLTAALDWEELVAEVEKIRATKVSSPGGRRPHLRALVGAVVLMSVRQCRIANWKIRFGTMDPLDIFAV